MTLAVAQLKQVMPSNPSLDRWLDPLIRAFAFAAIDGKPLLEAMFLAQAAHESVELMRLVENLNYSWRGLMVTFPTRVKTEAAAQSLHRKPVEIANFVYGFRKDLGNDEPGDGWMYRGRGIFQLTGKANYKRCGEVLKLDLVRDPDLLLEPKNAALSAAWFWNEKQLSACKGDLEQTTRKINGGLNGLPEREKYFRLARAALGVKD